MKLIDEKYRILRPFIDLLGDEVIMAQAWKKTHSYIRTHNWYADPLALDISALGLEVNAQLWAKHVRMTEAILTKLELVPAAKTEPWLVGEKGWCPKKSEKERWKKPPIRPLAHLTVRDQTWSTALMMCLADSVETAQGDCSIQDFHQAQKNGVYSYGNRLLCDWKAENKQAWFRWGNGETYRKFFTDYQNFLKRPIEIGRSIAKSYSDSDHVYVINMDLSKFYDRIDRALLLECLKDIALDKKRSDECPEFWAAAEKITNWQWDDDAYQREKELKISLGEVGKGLPQGLVAAGFFANAYMVKFDRSIGNYIGKTIPNAPGLLLHDYCRYVDDLRLVVSIEDFDVYRLSSVNNKWIEEQLGKTTDESLEINEDKTTITALSDLDNAGSISGRIAFLQGELSGPADRDALNNAMGVLEGLLSLQPEEFPDPAKVGEDKALIDIARFDHDIRPDTLKRFSANRLESIMRNKRKLGEASSSISQSSVSIENESELLAKKLVWAWMQDPSLALVLRKAIEIHPSPDLVEPVFDAVYRRTSIEGWKDKHTAAMMDYLLADLFRCCVDFNALFQWNEYPPNTDPSAVLDIAAMYAQKSIKKDNLPKFIKRQALLLLATLQKTVATNAEAPDESIQHSLHSILAGSPTKHHLQRLALFEIAAQITGKPEVISLVLLKTLEGMNSDEKYKTLEDFAKRGGPFWLALWKKLQKVDIEKEVVDRLKWAAPIVATDPTPRKQKLSKIIASDKNGFEHEAALIKLALGLINLANEGIARFPLSPNEISVAYDGSTAEWDEIWKPDVIQVHCSESSKTSSSDPRFVIPEWVNFQIWDNAIIYWVGAVLRAALVGSNDFTGNRWKVGDTLSYKGLKTNWFKRRMGMMHAPEALVGEYATASGWMAELLMKCLQWPGFESGHLQHADIAGFDDLLTLSLVLENRLRRLNDLSCKASGMPALITEVYRRELSADRGFRLVTVQPLLPRSREFTPTDPKLDNAATRARNRDHISKICHITYKTLTAKLKVDSDSAKASADLIVFPEVGVHPADQDLIKRLADKTRSIVFAGMVFLDHREKLVNVARWFIPDYRDSGRQWVIRDQGKAHMTDHEVLMQVNGHRPCQHIIEVHGFDGGPFRLSGAICYDATDLKLVTDLKNKTDLFVVCAHNRDVRTFDNMAEALNYHMYQHVVVVNKGEYGGSTIQAPYREQFDRLISHTHGVDQISINVADLDLAAFRRSHKTHKAVKTKPAGD